MNQPTDHHPVPADSLDRFVVLFPVVYLPVLRCRSCQGDRPHYVDDVMCRCQACGRTDT